MESAIARTDDGLLALRERKLVLDAIWLATLLLFLLGIAVPWYRRVLEVDLSRVTWVMLGYALVHVGVSLRADRLRSRRGLLGLTLALQIAGILVLGLVWYLLGGAQVPMFLLAFVVPVVASGILALRWRPYVLAALAVVVVWSVAVLTSQGLRWYLVQLDLPLVGWLTSLPLTRVQGPFPALEIEPAYIVVLLELFAILILATAMTTDSLAGVQLRLAARLDLSGEALREAEGLARRILQASFHPAALVDRNTHRVVQASESFLRQFLIEPGDLADRTLAELLAMPFPEPLHTALAQGGEVPFAVCRVGDETRIARISVYLIEHAGAEYAHVSLHDVSQVYYLQGALDVIEVPYLLLGADRRILYFNRAAKSLFGELYCGIPASGTLESDGAPSRWWDPAPRRSHRRQIRIKGNPYRADLVVADLPGQAGPLTVVTLHLAELPS